jgi:CRP-like cAMP-binding protein
MENPLVRKLEQYVRLSMQDRAALDAVLRQKVVRLRAREDVIREGDRPRHVYLVVRGWACRYKMLEDGRRQIMAFFLPGDLCDLNLFVLREMDHSVGALTPLVYAEIGRDTFERLTEHPRIVQAMWWDTLVSAAVQREWTVNLGQRTAFERIAHTLCELFLRLRGVGLADGDRCELPITQTELADAIGLTPVHVNRTLQDMRAQGLISLQDKELVIPDLERLQAVAMFNANYLHLDREGAHLDANDG